VRLRFIGFGRKNTISSWSPVLGLPRLEAILHEEGTKDPTKCPIKKGPAKCTDYLSRKVSDEKWKNLL
jgi:hypothetical protein